MNPHRHPPIHQRRRGHQPDAIAQVARQLDVQKLDLFDPLDLSRREVGRAVEGQGGQDGDLMAGVEAADVHGRIGLGVAEPLGLGQHLAEFAA